MKMKTCLKCGNEIFYKTAINNKIIYNNHRKYCFECSPYINYAPILTTELTNIQKEILNGHLLGDGFLTLGMTCNDASFNITRKAEDQNYLFWTKNYFQEYLTPKGIVDRSRYDKRTNKTYNCIEMHTRTSPLFTEYYNKWYPKGKKIVPEDLTLTPLIIAIWLADDGAVSNGSTDKTLKIKFATQGFHKQNVEFLHSQLVNLYGPRVKIQMADNKEQWIIQISHTPTSKILIRDIYDIFPPLPRKSDIWDNPLIDLWDKQKIISPNCNYCESTNTVKKGNNLNRQRYLCNDCDKTYYALKDYKIIPPNILPSPQ